MDLSTAARPPKQLNAVTVTLNHSQRLLTRLVALVDRYDLQDDYLYAKHELCGVGVFGSLILHLVSLLTVIQLFSMIVIIQCTGINMRSVATTLFHIFVVLFAEISARYRALPNAETVSRVFTCISC